MAETLRRPYGRGTGSATTDGCEPMRRAARRQRDVAGLQRVGVLDHLVGRTPAFTARCRFGRAAEAGGERQVAGAVAEQLPAHVVVDAHVGAAEAVDRLLRVADDEQLARPPDAPASSPAPPGRPTPAAAAARPAADRCPGTRPRRCARTAPASAARTPSWSRTRLRARCSRSKKSSSPRRAFRLLVALEAAAQLVAQQRRQIRIGVALEDVELQHQLLMRLVGGRAAELLGERSARSPCGRGGSPGRGTGRSAAPRPRRGRRRRCSSGQLVAGAPRRRRVEIQRIAQDSWPRA